MSEFDDAINKALDDYETMKRKAAAFDEISGVLTSYDHSDRKYRRIEKIVLDTTSVSGATL